MANEVQNLVVNGTTYPIGGGGLLVTLTTTTSGSSRTVTMDKTAQEIFDALSAGILPVIDYGSGTSWAMVTGASDSSSTYKRIDTNVAVNSISNIRFTASSYSGYPSYSYSSGGDN